MDRLPHFTRRVIPSRTTVVDLKAYFANQLAAWQTDVPPPRYTPSAPGQHSIVNEAIPLATETPEEAALREQFANLAGLGGEKQLDLFADMAAQAFFENIEVTDADRQDFKGQFKESVRQTLHKYKDDKSLLPEEKAILATFQAEIEKIKISVKAPTVEQVENSSKAATLAAVTGFAAIALFMKLLINFSPLGVSASHFVNLAGPLILLLAELLAGKYKAQGPGFSAVDSDAYQKWDQLNAQMHRVNAEVAGMDANPDTPPEKIDEAKRRFTQMRIGQQKAVFDCLTRELGHETGLKRDDHLPDVPKDTLLACISSKLTGDKATGEVRLPDGTLLFRVLNDKGDVQWPSSGACTNLLTEPVPTEHVQTFEAAAKLLIEAARCRSFICDDVPFHLFGLPFLWNMAGPKLLATHPHGELAAKWGDALLMVASSVIGTYAVLNAQNWMRKKYTGAPTSVGLHNAASQAKHEKAKFEEQALKARVEQGLNVVKELKADVAESKAKVKEETALFEALESELQVLADETTETTENLKKLIDNKSTQLRYAEFAFGRAQEQLGKTIDIISWSRVESARNQTKSELLEFEERLSAFKDSTSEKIDTIIKKQRACTENLNELHKELDVRIECKAKADYLYGNIVKNLDAAQRRVTSTGRKAGAMAILMKDVYESLFKEDQIRFISKLIAYTLCYMAFGGMYTPIAAHVVTSLSGKMAMAGLGGTFMSSIFMWRNVMVTPGLQYILHGLAGQLERIYATYKGYPSTSVSEMPQILEESPYNDDTLAEGGLRLSRAWEDWTSARQGLLKVDDARLLSRILHDLPNVAAIDAVLSNLDLNLDEQTDLEKATRVVLEGWDEWGPGFGGKESTMLHALQKIHTWAAWKLNERLVED